MTFGNEAASKEAPPQNRLRELRELLAVLDHLPATHYHWAIAQTMTAVGDAAPDDEADDDPTGRSRQRSVN